MGKVYPLLICQPAIDADFLTGKTAGFQAGVIPDEEQSEILRAFGWEIKNGVLQELQP